MPHFEVSSDFTALLPCTTGSAAETEALGRRIAEQLGPGAVLALYGDLGTGKTRLVKGIAGGLEIAPETVRSPTFTIVQTHPEGRLPLYHFDAYRVGSLDEFHELGYEEYVYGDGVTVIEWADRVESLVPPDALRLRLRHVAPEERRVETIEDGG